VREGKSFVISQTSAPPIGDVRAAGEGDMVFIRPGGQRRADWPRYAEALMIAVTRGADVRWVRAR